MRLAAIVLIGSAVLAQDRDEALEKIRAAEGNLRNAQFAMESQVLERSSEGELRPAIQFCDVEGLIVPGVRARYHVKIHASLPALLNRTDELVEAVHTYRREVCFDGTTESVIDYALDSFESPIRGNVNTPSSRQGEQGWPALFTNRLTHVLPLYESMGLSAYLATIPDEAPDWKVLPSEDVNRLTVWFPRANFTPDGLQDQMSYVVTLDLARGGNIVDWKWYLGYKDGGGQLMGALEDVQLEQVEGTWLPVAFVRRKYSYDPKRGENVVREETRTKLTWSHVNAELDPFPFHVEYPRGLRVGDESQGKYHVVGETESNAQFASQPDPSSSTGRAVPTLEEVLEALRRRDSHFLSVPLHIQFSRTANDLADSPPRGTEHTFETQFHYIREEIRAPDGASVELLNVEGSRVEIGHYPEPFFDRSSTADNAVRRLRYLAHDVQHQSEGTVGLWVNGPPAWLINHFRESAAAGQLTIGSESVDDIDCVTLTAGGTVLSLAPEYDWSPVRFNNVRGAQFAQYGELWFPSKIQQEFTYNSMSDPPFARYSEEIMIDEVRTGEDYRAQGYWSIPQPQDGDYVQVAYPAWEANWDIAKGLRLEVDPRVVRDACRNEHAFFWSDNLAEVDRLIWAVSTHWQNSRRINSALRTDQVHGDMGQAPLPFYDAGEEKIVWANYTGSTIRVGALPAQQEFAIGAHQVLVSFQPSATEIRVGETLSVSFSARNVGPNPFFLIIQGSQRGDRDDHYQFWAFDEQGLPAQIKWEAAHFGGLMGQLPRLAPGETWAEPLELEKWIVFDRPGVYTVRGRRVLQLRDKEGFPDGNEPQMTFFGDFQIRVLP